MTHNAAADFFDGLLAGSEKSQTSSASSPSRVRSLPSSASSPSRVWSLPSSASSPSRVWSLPSSASSPSRVWSLLSSALSPLPVWSLASSPLRACGQVWAWSRLQALLSCLLLLFAATASADVLKFARFHLLAGKSPNTFELDVQLPFVLTAQPAKDVGLPDGCKVTAQSAQLVAQETSAVIKFACDKPIRHGATIQVPWGEDGGVLTSSLTPGGATPRMIHGSEEGLALPLDAASEDRSLGAVAAEYTGLGVIHILEGLDHLAFVLCLCLLTRGGTLLLLVTAFTLGHSISLALSFLGIVSIPVPPVEATIALSIAFMAREALLARRGDNERRRTRLRYMAVVAAFGLLHGLGFASVLGDLGVAPGERIAGLIFFNVGVEIGQLTFVAAVTALMWLASRVRIDAPLRTAALYGVGVVGVFWTVERVAGFVA